ncbi:MAG: hypothetical protein KJ968_02005 [Nanoarchaeota archaeon]|nr:hypothetical protein [Nanoarchaeota archaeon]
MKEIGHLYQLLEKMVESAEIGDFSEVKKLNESYEKLVHKVFHDPCTQLGLEYDNCRQSCVMANEMPKMRDQFLLDAKKRFSKIPKPKH